MNAVETFARKAATGVEGLDDVMGGGFPRDRLYLIEGSSGSGKTTLALQFLMEGARQGERGLYLTLSETEEERRGGVRVGEPLREFHGVLTGLPQYQGMAGAARGVSHDGPAV
jgi:predicted ATP-dependent serine protease